MVRVLLNRNVKLLTLRKRTLVLVVSLVRRKGRVELVSGIRDGVGIRLLNRREKFPSWVICVGMLYRLILAIVWMSLPYWRTLISSTVSYLHLLLRAFILIRRFIWI